MNAVARDTWGLAVSPAAIPATLKRMDRWVVWAAVKDGDKTTKVPRQALNVARGASVGRPLDWVSFDVALAALESHSLLSGVGFMMTGVAGIIAVDLDHCIELGVIADWAQDIVHRLPGYWELSPSGRGLRGFWLGQLPGKSFLNREHGIEMYGGDSPRYVTVTGHRLDISTADLVTAPEGQLAEVYQHYCTAGAQAVLPHADAPPPVRDAKGVLEKARSALSERFCEYLKTGKSDDHSATLYGLCIALYGAGFEDDEVFAVLTETPHIVAVGERHWPGKALDYLWRRCALPAKGKASPVRPEDFDDVLAGALPQNGAQVGKLGFQPAPEIAIPGGQEGTPAEGLPGAVDLLTWASPPAPRQWVWEGWLAPGHVTMLYGAGGIGKTLLAQQLQTHLALGVPFMGAPVTGPAPSIGLYCEDDDAELHRRQWAINVPLMAGMTDLVPHLHIASRIEHDNALVRFDRDGSATVTAFARELVAWCDRVRPSLLVLDNVGDFFAGNEIIRSEVHGFMARLTRLARHFHCAVLLLAHPSRAGKDEGTSGSTAWENRARARLHLYRHPDDQELLVLEAKKSNYSRTGVTTSMRWVEGHLDHVNPDTVDGFLGEGEARLDGIVLDLLAGCTTAGDDQFGPTVACRDRYAPRKLLRVAAARRSAEGLTVPLVERSIDRLVAAGRVKFEQRGTRHAWRVVILPPADMPAHTPEWLL